MIGRAVKSALTQRPCPPAEVIVVDDCSTDATADAAAAAGARVVRRERNGGEGAARNTGIEHADQPWIALLDSDDEWLPHLLATLWPLRGDHVLVGGGSLICDEGSSEARYGGNPRRRPSVLKDPCSLIYPENFVASSGTMVRREIVRSVGGYTRLKGGADMDLWIRVLERGSGLIAPSPVVLYHRHGGQVTGDVAMMSDAHRTVAQTYAERPWWRPRALERWEGVACYDEARRAWSGGRHFKALCTAARLAVSPVRLSGAAGIVVRRARLRRRSGLVDMRGIPTVAVLPGVDSAPAVPGARDLRQHSCAGVLAELVRRPPTTALVKTRAQEILARAAGVRQVTRASSAPAGSDEIGPR